MSDDGEYREDDEFLEGEGSEGMDPNHPLLARAQAALKEQLLNTRQNIEEQLRERKENLKVRTHNP